VRERSVAQRKAWGALSVKLACGLQVLVFFFAGSAADNFNGIAAVFTVAVGVPGFSFSVPGVGCAAFGAFLAALSAIGGAAFLCYTAQGDDDAYQEMTTAQPTIRPTTDPVAVVTVPSGRKLSVAAHPSAQLPKGRV